MDSSQRANAAQLAARNIKQAKPKTGRRPVAARPESQAPQFSSMAGQPSGSLFGGAVQAPSTFSFAPPSGGPSFPPPAAFGTQSQSFGSPSPEVSDNEGLFEGDNRGGKRVFHGSSTMPQNTSFPPPFGQSQPTFAFQPANQPQASGGGMFGFGGPQAQNPSPTNFSTSTNSQQSTQFSGLSAPSAPGNIFGNAAMGASAPSISSNLFGTTSGGVIPSSSNIFGTASVGDAKQSNLFQFASQQSQPQPANSLFSFSQPAAQEKPAETPFQFGQMSSQPTGSMFNANTGSISASSSPALNISTPTAPPTTTGFQFQPTVSTAAPASSSSTVAPQPSFGQLFGANKFSEAPQATPLFAASSQAPSSHIFSGGAPANSTFSGNKNHNTPIDVLSGQPEAQAQNSFNLFSNKIVDTASSNVFTQAQAPTTSNFFQEKKPATATNNALANFANNTSSALFGNQAQQTTPSNNFFGGLDKELAATNNIFSNLNKPVDSSVSKTKSNGTDFTTAQPSTNNLFAQSKPLFSIPTPFQSTQATEPPQGSNSMFAKSVIPSAPLSSPTKNDASTSSAPNKPSTTTSQPPLNDLLPTFSQSAPNLQRTNDESGLPPNRFMPVNIHNGDGLFPLIATRSLTDEEIEGKVPEGFSAEDKQRFFATFRISRLNKAMQVIWSKLGVRDPAPVLNYYTEERTIVINHYGVALRGVKRKSSGVEEDQHPSKRSKQDDNNTSVELPPAELKNPQQVARSSSKPTEKPEAPEATSNSNDIFGKSKLQPGHSIFPSLNEPLGTKSLLSIPSNVSPSKSKRKATEELTKDTEQVNPLRREIKAPRLNGASSTPQKSGSQTSNMFKSILESPSDSPTTQSSAQKSSSLSEKPKDEAPLFNPFKALPVPKSPTKTPAAPLPAPKETSAPSVTANPTFASINTTSGSTKLSIPKFGAPTNFLAEFEEKAKKSGEDEEAKKLQAAIDEDYDSDDDLEEFKANWREKRAKEKKELQEQLSKPGKKFELGSNSTTNKPLFEASKKPNGNGIKPLFGQAPSTQSANGGTTLFGQTSSSHVPVNSVFSPVNGSRTSTPGPFAGFSGSVLNTPTSTKSSSLAGNIFSHLSDQESGKDGKDDDSADEESADEDSKKNDTGFKPGFENGSDTPPEKTSAEIASTKKPNLFSFGNTPASSSPFGKSGASLFGRHTRENEIDEETQKMDSGGTTTPGGSIFDRITKDSNGNPARQTSTEEKENTQPSSRNLFGDSANPFGSLNKASAPADQTWKPNSPIKFGTATTDSTSAPTIGVISATPTKPATQSFFGGATTTPVAQPFAGLFGKPMENKSGSSSLFANLNAAKTTSPSVGFGFGAPSGPPSSLLPPSGLASATTSRATTPGATTDGDSGTDADPDAERHEQIDLLALRPGEENEETIHEVRAKALKFFVREEGDSKNPWETQGLGPLRILKHKETGTSRVLLRQDPTGAIVLNKSILGGGVKYEASEKTVKLLTAGDDGKGMETWLLQVKTPGFAQKLAEVLEENKPTAS